MYVCFGNRIMLHLRLTAQRYISLKISFIKQRRTLIMKYLWCSRGVVQKIKIVKLCKSSSKCYISLFAYFHLLKIKYLVIFTRLHNYFLRPWSRYLL